MKPSQKMIEWFDYEFNQEPENNDALESDMWYSELQTSFFEEFEDEMKELSYMEMIDIFTTAKEYY